MLSEESARPVQDCRSRPSLHAVLAVGVAVMLLLMALHAFVPVVVAQADKVRVLNYGMDESIDSANPFVGVADNEYIFYMLIYDYLTIYDKDGNIQPNLAESWWYMDGPTAATLPEPTDFSGFAHSDPNDWPLGSIWEYNLTEGIYWNDGTPFTADDVVWTINIQLGDNYMVFWAYQPFTRWIDHVEKVNDNRVRIFFADMETLDPLPVTLGDKLCMPILPKHAFAGKSTTYLAFDWDGTPSIATGPFMGTSKLRSEVIAKQAITLVKNPYYDAGLGAKYNRTIEIDRLVIKFYSEQATLALAVRTGDLDCSVISPDTYLGWKNNPGAVPSTLNLISMLTPRMYSKQISFNAYEDSPGTLSPLRLDPAVQRAAALATNKSYIIAQVYKGLAVEGVGLFSPIWSDWWWEPGEELSTFMVNAADGSELFSYSKPMSRVIEFDPGLANQILDAAGYVWTGTEGASVRKAGPVAAERLEAMFGISPDAVLDKELRFENVIEQELFDDKQIADYISVEWKQVGIFVHKEMVNSPTWNSLIYSYTFNTMQTYWSGYPDPNYVAFVPTTYALFGWNEFGTSNTTYDEYYFNQVRALDYDTRKQWVDECLKWQYLSGGVILTTVYPMICYAFNDARWTNWGNWTEHPGLAIDHYFGENELWYTLKYEGTRDIGISMSALLIGVLIIVAVIISVAAILAAKKRKMERAEMLEKEEEEI